MSGNRSPYLPQIEYHYKGTISPFIGNADLKTLVRWRTEKIDSDAPWGYNKDAKNAYFEHLDCIEQCIKILFSNPTPEFAINKLAEQQESRVQNERETTKRIRNLLNNIPDNEKEKLSAMISTFFK